MILKQDGILNTLVIADIHAGQNEKTLGQELGYSFIGTIHEMKDTLDLVVISGDLFDRKINMNEPAGRMVSNFISTLLDLSVEYGFAVRILKGTRTHDFDQLNFFQPFVLKPETYDFKIINTISAESLIENVLTVLYVPEEYMENAEEYIDEYLDIGEAKYDLIFFHGMFDFIAVSGKIQQSERTVKDAPTLRAKKFEAKCYGPIVGGHIHDHQDYKDKIFYTGSFSRFAHGEEEPKGFLHVEYNINTMEYEVNFIENEYAPTYKTIYLTPRLSPEEQLKEIETAKEQYNFVRISNKGDFELADLKVLKEAVSDKNLKVNIKIQDKTAKIEELPEDLKSIVAGNLSLEESIKTHILHFKQEAVSIDDIKKAIIPD